MNFLAFALKFLLVRITAYLKINIKHLTRISSPILLLGVSIYWTKHFYSSLTYYFSVYQGIGWNTPSRVWFITSRCLDIRWKTPSPVWFTIYFLMFGYQMKHSFSYLIYYFSPVQKFYRDLAEILTISARFVMSLRSRQDLTELKKISSRLTKNSARFVMSLRSRRDKRDFAEISPITQRNL